MYDRGDELSAMCQEHEVFDSAAVHLCYSKAARFNWDFVTYDRDAIEPPNDEATDSVITFFLVLCRFKFELL